MAYNPMAPGYYAPQYQPYQDQLSQLRSQQYMPPQMPPAPPAQQSAGFSWVQGENAAKAWLVAPGSTVLLMDSESSRFYLKTVDQTGVPSMRTFEYSEVTNIPKAPQADVQYVSREEHNALSAKINELAEKLEALSAPVEITPLAARKAVKAKEANADE